MKRDETAFLADILDAVNDISSYVAGATYEQFLQNKMMQDAVVRRLEIIGEAASNISVALHQAHPEVEWGQIIGMRDRLIHAYALVDLVIVWEVVHIDLPQLKQQIEHILREQSSRRMLEKGLP